MWTCPECGRTFTRARQRHACGTGERSTVLRGRSAHLVALYDQVEAFVKSLGPVECVTRERYILFRSRRVFADAVVMTDALRLAIHLGRRVEHSDFIKVVAEGSQVTAVVKLRHLDAFDAMKPFLREAYEHSLLEPRPT